MKKNWQQAATDTGEVKRNPFLYLSVLLLFGLTLGSFLTRLPDALHDWTSGWYAMDYSMGFGSRLLIGSLLHLFYPDFLPASAAYGFVILTLALLLFVLFLLIVFCFYKVPTNTSGNGLAFMILLYLASPGSVAYLWSTEILGRFDMYLILITLLCVLLWLLTSSYGIRCLIILILGSLCLAIHQVFLFLFFPVVFAMLLLPLDFGSGSFSVKTIKKETKRNLLLGILLLLFLAAQLLFYQFGSSLNIGSSQDLAALLSARTDLPVMENALYFEYFAGFGEMLSEVVMNEIGERIRYTLIAFTLLSPVFFFYGYFIRKMCKAEQTLTEKWKLLLIPFSLLSFLPAFVLTKDWGRWSCALLLVLLLQVILLTLTKKETAASAFYSMNKLVRKLWIPLTLYIIFLACLEKYQCILLPQAPKMFQFLYQLIRG